MTRINREMVPKFFYRWGALFSDKSYMETVNKQLKVQKLAARAQEGFTDEEQATVALHSLLQARYSALKAAARAHHAALIDNALAQIDALRAAAEASGEALEESWRPVSTRHIIEPTELADRCWAKALQTGYFNAADNKTQVRVQSALNEFSQAVREEHLFTFYQDNAHRRTLGDLTDRQIGVVDGEGDHRAASVFVPQGTHPLFQLLLSLALPQRQPLLQLPLLGPLPGAPEWAILPSQPLATYFSDDKLKILTRRRQYGNLRVEREAPTLHVFASQLSSKPDPPHIRTWFQYEKEKQVFEN